jgi:hypothetical protein
MGARGGACKGDATTLQPWILRLIRNADYYCRTVCVVIIAGPSTNLFYLEHLGFGPLPF